MRVHIVGDMEGVGGIVHPDQTNAGAAQYEEGRRLYTEEVNAAVRGAKAAGATEVVVVDCRGAGDGYSFDSLVHELLEPDCEYVVRREWTEYTEFLESGVAAALFVGVALVTGDDAVCREARALLGEGPTAVAVKRGLGARSARHVPPRRARALIEEGAREALADLSAVAPYDPGRPCEIRVGDKTTLAPGSLRHAPAERVDGRTIVSRADTWWQAWRRFFFFDRRRPIGTRPRGNRRRGLRRARARRCRAPRRA